MHKTILFFISGLLIYPVSSFSIEYGCKIARVYEPIKDKKIKSVQSHKCPTGSLCRFNSEGFMTEEEFKVESMSDCNSVAERRCDIKDSNNAIKSITVRFWFNGTQNSFDIKCVHGGSFLEKRVPNISTSGEVDNKKIMDGSRGSKPKTGDSDSDSYIKSNTVQK